MSRLKGEKPGCELSIIIPVRNERDSLPRLLRDLMNASQLLDRSHEIIFVDDAHT